VGVRAAFATLAVSSAVLAAGCGAVGRSTTGDPSAGKSLFVKECASCHTLANAKTTGTIGPNLDDAFASVKAQGFDESTIRDVVRGQIAYAESPMPQDLVTGNDADSVAAYVAKCSAAPACGVEAAKPTPAETGETSTGKQQGVGGSAEAAGKKVFVANCGGCHTLKNAGTHGTTGPNLDQLKPTLDTVQTQVTNGGAVMPAFKDKLSNKQIGDVAEYVSAAAGE
jgi:mono/diheme cytochrome c family protein